MPGTLYNGSVALSTTKRRKNWTSTGGQKFSNTSLHVQQARFRWPRPPASLATTACTVQRRADAATSQCKGVAQVHRCTRRHAHRSLFWGGDFGSFLAGWLADAALAPRMPCLVHQVYVTKRVWSFPIPASSLVSQVARPAETLKPSRLCPGPPVILFIWLRTKHHADKACAKLRCRVGHLICQRVICNLQSDSYWCVALLTPPSRSWRCWLFPPLVTSCDAITSNANGTVLAVRTSPSGHRLKLQT